MNDYQQGQAHGYTQALADVRTLIDDAISAILDNRATDSGAPQGLLRLKTRLNTLERERAPRPAGVEDW